MRRLLLIPAAFALAAVIDGVVWDEPQVTIDAPGLAPGSVQVGTSVSTPTPRATSGAPAPDVPTKDGGGS